ncbi:MAG: hypothetical protein K8W52_31870 [Deltaproteobacteria bacterium]|nr:hypothetical protein [Deltaproteobacteria bacterium]
MIADLDAAIAGLYAAFAGRPRPARVEGCPCCVGDGAEAGLHRAPLRELTGDDLGRYSFKAMTTWGSVSDFAYFVPRLLELATRGADIDLEVVTEKLRYGNWRTWPAVEVAAIERFAQTIERAAQLSGSELAEDDVREALSRLSDSTS